MQIPDDTPSVNLNGCMPVPAMMARIATMLEEHGSVYVTGASVSGVGPGFCAYLMGQAAEKAAQGRGARGGSLDERGGTALQESQTSLAGGAPAGDEGPRSDAG